MTALATVVALAGFTSCHSADKLAQEVEGDWSGTPIRFAKKTMVNGEFTPTLSFVRNGEAKGGDVTITAMLSVTLPVNAPIDSLGTTAVSATAAGIATVRGTWEVRDDDDIRLNLDKSTLVIDVDPSVEFELTDIWSSSDVPAERKASDAVLKAFEKEMSKGMEWALRELDEVEDVKIKDNLMTCELADSHQTLNKIFQ